MKTKYDLGQEIMFVDADNLIKKAIIVRINIYKEDIDYIIKNDIVFHTIGSVYEKDIIENIEQAKEKIENIYNENLNKLKKEKEKMLSLLEV